MFVANDGAQNDDNSNAAANTALGDYLQKGYPSIALTHFSEQYLQLLRNDGKLSFTDLSNTSNIVRAPLSPSDEEVHPMISTTMDGLISLPAGG